MKSQTIKFFDQKKETKRRRIDKKKEKAPKLKNIIFEHKIVFLLSTRIKEEGLKKEKKETEKTTNLKKNKMKKKGRKKFFQKSEKKVKVNTNFFCSKV